MPAGIVHTESDPVTEHAAADVTDSFSAAGITAACLVGTDGRAEAMTQHMLTVPSGRYDLSAARKHDQLLYVLSGQGSIQARDGSAELSPGTAALIPAGEAWTVTSEGLHVSYIRVPAPSLPAAAAQWQKPGAWTLTSQLGEQARQAATSDRQFEVLYDNTKGCGGATQFVGFIPQTGAPEHYHLYDEICTVVRGFRPTAGRRHHAGADGGRRPSMSPPRFLHAVHNCRYRGPAHAWVCSDPPAPLRRRTTRMAAPPSAAEGSTHRLRLPVMLREK